jgi:replicative DNA helicase
MHYITNKINNLTDDEKQTILSELIESVGTVETKADKISVVMMLDYTEQARERLASFGKMQGLSSGYPSIDRLTKGFVGGEMVVIAGKTSFGKTTLAMNIANRMGLAGKRILFVSMEMTHVELTSRYMFINGGENEDYTTVAANTLFQKNDELDWKSIDGLIEHAKEALNVDIVIIDHLHYFTRELQNVAEDLGRITKEIKKNAIRHDIPVLLISHVRKTNQSATMEDLRGSSYIAQDADIVLMVGRIPEDESLMIVRIEKNRNRGYDYKNDTVELGFDKTKITDPQDRIWNT